MFELTKSHLGIQEQNAMLLAAARLHLELEKDTDRIINFSPSQRKRFIRDGMATQMKELGYSTGFVRKHLVLYRAYQLYEDFYFYFIDRFSQEDASMGSVQLSMLTLANKYLEHEFKIKGYANVFDFLKRDGYSKEILDEYIQPNKSNKFNWDDVTRFFDWDGRPAVVAFPPDESVSGWVVRSGDNAGSWTEADPALISASGRPLLSEVFHEVFADKLTDVEKVDSSVTLPLDFTTAVRFFSLDWRPAVITRSDEVVEGWFSPEAGKPFRPLELGDILSNGRELSKADFQEMFPDDVAGADAITSNIDLPNTVSFDWNDVSAFFDWEGRPAVTVMPSDGLLEGWFAATPGGDWVRVSPVEILDSGLELSKAEFQNVFAEFFTHD
jgi:hypothetical protein